MNKIVTTVLLGSLALGGFTVANADYDGYKRYDGDDRYEHSEDHDRYERGEHKGKYCNKHGKKSSGRMEYMIKHLDLSEQQAKQVRSIRENYQPKMQALREKMKENRKELREAMHADTIEQGKIKKLAQTMGELKTNKIMLRSEMRAEIHKVLTKEQREKMKSMKGKHGYKHHS